MFWFQCLLIFNNLYDIKMAPLNIRTLDVKFQIGKNGITDALVNQIKNYLKKHGIVKIKMLKSFMENNDKKKSAKLLAEKLDAELVKLIGFTIVLKKKFKFKD